MKFAALSTVLATTLISTVAAAPLEERQTTAPVINCTKGIVVLAARGTDNNHNDATTVDPAYADIGDMQHIANQLIAKAGQNSYLQALPYPAAPGANYFASIAYGIDAAQSFIKDYVGNCSATVTPRIVLLGYSQGGQVLTSTLIGGQGRPNLNAYKQYITTGSFYGSPSFRANVEPIDAGNATTSGTFARDADDYAYFNNNYGQKLRNWCTAGDFFCANGVLTDPNLDIHHAEVQTWGQQSLQFMLPKV